MKKWIVGFSILIATIILIFIWNGKSELTRIDVEVVEANGNNDEEVMITEESSIENLRSVWGKIEWEPNKIIDMEAKEVVKATHFLKVSESKPEKLVNYSIWFHKDGTSTIISDEEDEGFGELDEENTKVLEQELLNN
ncbi:hypothetical protein [Aquibacillus sediminis]|uniref:hypothetical protein n=1 Tax=Aquibacillus sediminis TaxID=2574734 RepID=UPI001107AC9E|nr:hypothetical protein [Aquibacillus sediminis]